MTHPAVTTHPAPPQVMAPAMEYSQPAQVTTYAAPAVEYSQPAQITTYAAPPVQAQVSYLPPVVSSDPQMAQTYMQAQTVTHSAPPQVSYLPPMVSSEPQMAQSYMQAQTVTHSAPPVTYTAPAIQYEAT